MGTRHMAVAGHYGAAHAAFAMLEAGGNAVDAGVAAGIALGVLQSDLVNVAGVAPIMIYRAEEREVLTISGLGTWPRAVTPDLFQKHHGGRIPDGLLRTVVPAAPDAWITALEQLRHDELRRLRRRSDPLRERRLPDVRADVGHDRHARRGLRSVAVERRDLSCRTASRRAAGELFVQADLGRTLQYMADEEKAAAGKGRAAGLQAARDAFYRGDIARTIVAYHEANGGLMTAQDMADFRVAIEPPVTTRFAGIDVYACGPWCQGPVLAADADILAGIDLKGMGHNSLDYVHVVTEAIKLAFADRERYYGDPRFVNVPIDTLLSDAYAQRGARCSAPTARGRECRRRARFAGFAARRAPAPTAHRAAVGRARHVVCRRGRQGRQRVLGHAQRSVLRHAGDSRARDSVPPRAARRAGAIPRTRRRWRRASGRD